MRFDGVGEQVHAATFVRGRRIVLERALLEKPRELARIVIHEVFHFAWARLGNPDRRSFEVLLTREFRQRARGELGWSAQTRKNTLHPPDCKLRSPAWRLYVCESFCDTAAWVFRGGRHPEFTLAESFRLRRKEWFQDKFRSGVRI